MKDSKNEKMESLLVDEGLFGLHKTEATHHVGVSVFDTADFKRAKWEEF